MITPVKANSGELIFWEKPGCIGNHQQKQALLEQGQILDVRDLLSMPWSFDALRPFFNQEPVKNWFNMSAPAVKSGEINVESLTEHEAIKLMVAQPILIRRPLMQTGKIRQAGFYDGPVLREIDFIHDAPEILQDCPMDVDSEPCEVYS